MPAATWLPLIDHATPFAAWKRSNAARCLQSPQQGNREEAQNGFAAGQSLAHVRQFNPKGPTWITRQYRDDSTDAIQSGIIYLRQKISSQKRYLYRLALTLRPKVHYPPAWLLFLAPLFAKSQFGRSLSVLLNDFLPRSHLQPEP
jgi:hypothetical protein